jgi:hypothetical protein
LDDEQVQQIFYFARFLQSEEKREYDRQCIDNFNQETIAAIEEVEEMSKNPSKLKKYSSFSELYEDVMKND